MPNTQKLRTLLLQHAKQVRDDYEFPWLDQRPLSLKNANKFFLGAIIDYRIKKEVAWNNARTLAEKTLDDPERLWNHITATYTQDEWEGKWREFGVHRFPVAHNRIWRIGSDIVNTYNGDCRMIWKDRQPREILSALREMRCGEQISRMIVGALITYKHISGTGDVKADVHVQRVLGSIFGEDPAPDRATQLARKIHPDNPWDLDWALLDIGENHCRPKEIFCTDCPIVSECRTAVR